MTRELRVMLAAVGWTGHAFPAISLGRELHDRGHDVLVETFERWRDAVAGLGMRFAAAEERFLFPGPAGSPPVGANGRTLAQVVRALVPRIREFEPDVVVSDSFTVAPALAAEMAGARRATLIPHTFPVREPGLPFYTLGLLPPRTPLGSAAWRAAWPLVGTRLPNTRLRKVRASLDIARAELGLPPVGRFDGQISEELAMVATFPQLEYPRRWPAHVHVTGPMIFELPYGEVELPEGARPLVLVTSSTERDPELGLVEAALEGLDGEPVRVVATTNRRGAEWTTPVPDNAVVVDWLSYSQVMPEASVVVCHGGHGTVSRALDAGVPVLVSPPAGDMAETGARVTWAGAGAMLPARIFGPGPLRWAVRRLLSNPRYRRRAAEIAAWSRDNDGAAQGADRVERYALG